MRILAAAFVLLSAVAAHAETAEETVAYIVAGAQENPWQKTGDSPLSYKIHLDNGDLSVSVKQVSDCAYDVTVGFALTGASKTDGGSYQIDFSRAVDIEMRKDGPFRGFSNVKISDTVVDCKGDDRCAMSFKNDRLFLSNASPKRAQRAIDYLRAQYCKGSAF